jgi:ribose 5-phosphate isomerase
VTSIEDFKRAAAARAVEYVEPGMRIGLGTGSTARHFVELLGERVQGGLRIAAAVPTSESTRRRQGRPAAVHPRRDAGTRPDRRRRRRDRP